MRTTVLPLCPGTPCKPDRRTLPAVVIIATMTTDLCVSAECLVTLYTHFKSLF